MKTNLRVIVDNTVSGSLPLLGEHGLSILIDRSERILFDTGFGNVLIYNLEKLEIDVCSIDKVVLSHGHVDHTGGLLPLLEKRGGKKLDVFCHGDVFRERFSMRPPGNEKKDLTIKYLKEKYQESGAVFHFFSERAEVCPGITAHTGMKYDPYGTIDPHLKVIKNGTIENDPLDDDLSLYIKSEKGKSIVFGCAHKGFVNIVKTISERENINRIKNIIGGGHLRDVKRQYLDSVINICKDFHVENLAMGHCTGFKSSAYLYSSLGDVFSPLHSGYTCEL